MALPPSSSCRRVDAIRTVVLKAPLALALLLALRALCGGLASPEAWAQESQQNVRPAPESEPSTRVPAFVLYGVIIAGGEPSALLMEPELTRGKIQKLHKGAQIGPYRLRGIEPARVILALEGRSTLLIVPLGAPAASVNRGVLPSRPPGIMPSAPAESPEKWQNDAAKLERLSRDLGVSVGTLQVQREQRGMRSWSSLIFANLIAQKSGLTAEQVAAEIRKGKDWGTIARERSVDLGELNRESNQLHEALDP